MEFFLNYPKYLQVKARYNLLGQKNEDWAEENADIIAMVTNDNEGAWEEKFDEKTAEVVTDFLNYSENINLINSAFSEATPRVNKMLNQCYVLPSLLDGNLFGNITDDAPWSGHADDLMYNSEHHDSIITEAGFVSEYTDEEEEKLKLLGDVVHELEYVNSSLIDDSIDEMSDGILVQRILESFITLFQDYVTEVNDFNTVISSKMADAVGVYSEFPEFTRETDPRLYAEEHYSYTKPAREGDSSLYDANGMYGGDQGHPLYTRGIYDKDYYDFIRSQPGFENYTDMQIRQYLWNMNEEGCGYVSAVGVILQAYEGNEKEFEEKYGIPYYTKNGEINYDQLFFLYYAETCGNVFTDGANPSGAYYNGVVAVAVDDPDAFEKKYGVPLYNPGTEDISDEARQKIYDEYNEKVAKGDTVLVTGETANTQLEQPNRLDHFTKEHGDTLTAEDVDVSDHPLTEEEFLERTANGEVLELSAHDFSLYNDYGIDVMFGTGGGHSMTITGITDDGRYIVSSWGKEYYFDPDKCDSHYVHSYKLETD